MNKIICTAKIICALIVFTLFGGVASAQTPPDSWQGAMTIRTLSAGCTQDDAFRIGKIAFAVYKPLSGGTRLQFVFDRTAANYLRTGAGQMKGAGSYTATKLGSRAGVTQFSGTFSIVQSPATVVATTPNVILTGSFTNFHDKTGCTVGFTALMTKRPANSD
jgi:hypothetical protein